jgi:hypothetical protein
VVISDGEDRSEQWPSLVRRLAEAEVVVHAVAVGTPQGSLLPVSGGGYKLDQHGEAVVSRLQLDALRHLVRETGGELVIVDRAGVSPAPIVDAVGRLEARSLGRERVHRQQERFQWFLAPAALALALALAWPPFRPSTPDAVSADDGARRRGR